MYIDERLLKILDTHKGETIDVNFMISLIKTIAKEHEMEQLPIDSVIQQRELLKAFIKWNNKHNGIAQPVSERMADNYLDSL